jgi:hypothetical protein
MVETAAHLVDNILPRVPFRQWVMSVPKRVRWFLLHHPAAAGGLLRVLLRVVQTRLRLASCSAPPWAQSLPVTPSERIFDDACIATLRMNNSPPLRPHREGETLTVG